MLAGRPVTPFACGDGPAAGELRLAVGRRAAGARRGGPRRAADQPGDRGAGLKSAGAGLDAARARRPVAVPVRGGGRVLIFSCGDVSSGIPSSWAATGSRPGVDLLPDLSDAAADAVAARARAVLRPGDLAVVSTHWGSNWGTPRPRTRSGSRAG